MQVKIFTADALHQAIALAREALGPDAVILDRHSTVDDAGNKQWHVHAAVDRKPQEIAAPVNTERRLRDSMLRLQQIIDGLGQQEAGRLREGLQSDDQRQAFDRLCAAGVNAGNAFAMSANYVTGSPVGAPLNWGRQLDPAARREVVALVGPSGAGKTTMAAKIATHFKLQGIEVLFLSLDNERIGAFSALQTYAEVLGAPCLAIHDAEEARRAIERHASARLVLIDTDGQAAGRRRGAESMAGLLHTMECTRRFLVMPAYMDEQECINFIDVLSPADPTDLVPTKIDETGKPGKVINMAVNSGLALSYCSIGADVPDDLSRLTPESILATLARV